MCCGTVGHLGPNHTQTYPRYKTTSIFRGVCWSPVSRFDPNQPTLQYYEPFRKGYSSLTNIKYNPHPPTVWNYDHFWTGVLWYSQSLRSKLDVLVTSIKFWSKPTHAKILRTVLKGHISPSIFKWNSVDGGGGGGASGGGKRVQTWERGPPSAPAEFQQMFWIKSMVVIAS